jgi:hypothetical protein
MSFNRGDESSFNRRTSVDVPSQPHEGEDSYFAGTAAAPPRPGNFHRRLTNVSQKAKKAAKGDDGAGTYINLEGGLAITLNLEISPSDPAGITAPYKLLVPALYYNGTEYDPPPTQIVKGWRKFLPRRKKREGLSNTEHTAEDDLSEDEQDDFEDDDLINNTRANAATAQHPQYEGYPGSEEDDYSESEVPQRLPPHMMTESYPESEENPRPRKKWFGVI